MAIIARFAMARSVAGRMGFPVLLAQGFRSSTPSTDLTLGAYGWAYPKPLRKIDYNMTITLVSIVVAVVIGGVEALGLLADQPELKGPVWDAIGSLNDNFGMPGCIIIGIFALSWIASLVLSRLKHYDEVQPSQQV